MGEESYKRRNVNCSALQKEKREYVEVAYLKTLYNWRYDGSWKDNSLPTDEKETGQQCILRW